MSNPDVDEALLRLVTTAPAYRRRWSDETEKDPPYVAVAHFAFFLGREGKVAAPDVCHELFAVVEDLLTTGAPAVRNFVIVGFLEDLQNATLQASQPLDSWEQWFGSATLEAWRAVSAFWDGRMDAQSFKQLVDSSRGAE